MVAISKCFAMLMAFGAAVAAPLAASTDSQAVALEGRSDSAPVMLEGRPNHNPSAATLIRGTNNRGIVLMLGFTHLPTALSAQGYQVMRDLIQNKFMTWMSHQPLLLRHFWSGLIQGNNGDYIQSVARLENGVVQYMLAIDLHAPNSDAIANYIIRPLVAYLQNAGVQVHQQAGPLTENAVEHNEGEVDMVGPPHGVPAAPKCAAIPSTDPFQYANNNPPAPFNAEGSRWCK